MKIVNKNSTSIKHWAKDDRPREKLRLKGPAALSNAELLAILLGNGTRERSAVDLAREIMQKVHNNPAQLGRLTVEELLKIKGIGPAKAITIAAALELGLRRQAGELPEKTTIHHSRDIVLYLQSMLGNQTRELFAIILLNQASHIIHFEIISEGGITATVADPRIILRKALENEAVKIILCHNHPSGNLKPSHDDKQLTSKISGAARLMDMQVMDHVIVSSTDYFSFADEGLL
ncbi:MAG: DNA repair protein RadC [Dinghuibacter sp.]|nr:DNA repair protein RadC [Dinghuibacter sp.]